MKVKIVVCSPKAIVFSNVCKQCYGKNFAFVMINSPGIFILYLRPEALLNTIWAQVFISLSLFFTYAGIGVGLDFMEVSEKATEDGIKPSRASKITVGFMLVATVLTLIAYYGIMFVCSFIEVTHNWEIMSSYDRGIHVYLIVALGLVFCVLGCFGVSKIVPVYVSPE
jgi:hypothetical protein